MVRSEGKKRLLIVDDEEDLTWSISKSFTKNDNRIETVCVHRGDDALRVLTDRRIDVVISDIRMPGKDGIQLLTEVRKHFTDTPVIIISAYGTNEIQDEIVSHGGSFYIEKPFEISHLRKLVYDVLNLTPPVAEKTTRNSIVA